MKMPDEKIIDPQTLEEHRQESERRGRCAIQLRSLMSAFGVSHPGDLQEQTKLHSPGTSLRAVLHDRRLVREDGLRWLQYNEVSALIVVTPRGQRLVELDPKHYTDPMDELIKALRWRA